MIEAIFAKYIMPVISFLIVMAGGSAVYYRQKSKITGLEKELDETKHQADNANKAVELIRADAMTQEQILARQAVVKAKWTKQMEINNAFRDEEL